MKKSIGKIKHLEGVFLTDTLHPLISENMKKLIDKSDENVIETMSIAKNIDIVSLL